jgi:hypothetical protein
MRCVVSMFVMSSEVQTSLEVDSDWARDSSTSLGMTRTVILASDIALPLQRFNPLTVQPRAA